MKQGKCHPDYDPVAYYGDLLWTRVKSRQQLGTKRVVTFPIGVDVARD